MYLKRISLENIGPIAALDLSLPFEGERPLPVVLVGANGSGKTTLLSFIVNALVAFKQQVVDEAEVEQGRVYRVRSGLFIRGGANFYRAKLQFEDGLWYEEWRLDRPREQFEKDVKPLPANDGWKNVPPAGADHFKTNPESPTKPFRQAPNAQLQKLFDNNVVLLFPSDRFEPPDWLNQKDLNAELQFPEPVTMQGYTARRIFARSLLKPTLNWLQAVALDQYLAEQRSEQVPIGPPIGLTQLVRNVLVWKPGKNTQIVNSATAMLGRILGLDSIQIQLGLDQRNSRRFFINIGDPSKPTSQIPNLLGLSAGQSALFCLFCNIIRDADMAGVQFSKPEEIRGIVLIDEADLHLHLGLQYRVLPELMKMFPRIQFIVTAHSPLLVMGMREAFSEDGFWLVDMPSGNRISTEAYSEFLAAFEAFGQTKRFEDRMLQETRDAKKPLLVVEGKHDKTILGSAWSKLRPGEPMPFEIISCGDDGADSKKNEGGASRLRLVLNALGATGEVRAVGLFDNDQPGNGQFGGMKAFETGDDDSHKRHPSGRVHALLLPVPIGREALVPAVPSRRLLELEHYFGDAFLDLHGAKQVIYPGLPLFSIQAKSALAEAAKSADVAEFISFGSLFDRLLVLFARL